MFRQSYQSPRISYSIHCLALSIVALLAAAGTAAAASYHVPGDFAAIQPALDAAATGDTVLVAPGTYTGPSNRNLHFGGEDVVLIGTGGSAVTILDCEAAGNGVELTQGEAYPSEIRGFTIRNGVADQGGGIRFYGGGARLRDIRILDCSAILGGGLYLRATGSPMSAVDLLIGHCDAGNGGAIYNHQTTLEFEGITLAGNSASSYGSAIWNHASQVAISRAIIAYNHGPESSAAIQVNSPMWVPEFSCSDFQGNTPCLVQPGYTDPLAEGTCFALEPFFCDLSAGDFTLHAISPCLPGGNACGQLIGALGQGCDYPLYAISGSILDASAQGISGVELQGSPYPLFTEATGDYTLRIPPGWAGTLTPEHPSYAFTPLSRDYGPLAADIPDQDYAGAHDDTLQVPGQFNTIQAALDYAMAGDVILLAAGTYSGPGFDGLNFDGKAISLIGAGAGVSILQGGGANSGPLGLIFENGEGPQTLIQDLSLVGFPGSSGPEGGAVFCDGSSPTLRDLEFAGNGSGYSYPFFGEGGALRCWSASPLVDSCRFVGNVAQLGGAVYLGDGAAQFVDCSFEAGNAWRGGAVFAISAWPQFTRCSFLSNTANRCWIDDVLFESGRGGAVYVDGGVAGFTDCLFAHNVAEESSTVPPPYYSDNSPGRGAGVYAQAGELALSGCTFVDNSALPNAVGEAGVIHHAGGLLLQVENSLVAHNPAGRGIFLGSQAVLALGCNDVWGNPAGNYGGLVEDPTGTNGNIAAEPYFCDPAQSDYHLAQVSPCLPGNNSCGVLMGAFGEGCVITTGVVEALPAALRLDQPHPNPFNPATAIDFALPAAGVVDLVVYDLVGRALRRLLAQQPLTAGPQRVTWDGRDDTGRELPSGVYFVRLEAAGQTRTQKAILLK